jgi:hypothetical protein
MLQIVASLVDDARVVIYILALARIVIYSFIVLAAIIAIINYNCTVITMVNYDHKTFIVHATRQILWRLAERKKKSFFQTENDIYVTFNPIKRWHVGRHNKTAG